MAQPFEPRSCGGGTTGAPAVSPGDDVVVPPVPRGGWAPAMKLVMAPLLACRATDLA
jgi:hypothetical protein